MNKEKIQIICYRPWKKGNRVRIADKRIVTVLDNGDAEFFVCTRKDQVPKESFQLLNELVKANNFSIIEKGNQFLISQI